ncbi:nuclear transport factor 2 family protein [Phytoactinopolyspora alkaliphila]|uniref:Nuclear transport factor 2 family protein n=1 Tax=Phytoactinopolyspora alkaliphila TaxID=1783498 RepID=A0A6N9YJK1_9ACTN|nr:nuclear transport factor 2 family protein [Phytoactinopolyspora alkaliphila]NED95127.1 nuclear transport factor 2 family protein [Phytoactinopolyspora alkaliphila]
MNGDHSPDRVDTTVAAWQAATENGDADAAAVCLADDAVFISPLTARFQFRGRVQIHEMLTSAFEVISGVRVHTVVGSEDTRAVFFTGTSGSVEFEEAQLLRFGEDGLITEITLFGRPLPGVTAVMAGIGPRMVRRQGRRRLAVVVGAAVRPLAAMTRLGERYLVPLTDPNRR